MLRRFARRVYEEQSTQSYRPFFRPVFLPDLYDCAPPSFRYNGRMNAWRRPIRERAARTPTRKGMNSDSVLNKDHLV